MELLGRTQSSGHIQTRRYARICKYVFIDNLNYFHSMLCDEDHMILQPGVIALAQVAIASPWQLTTDLKVPLLSRSLV